MKDIEAYTDQRISVFRFARNRRAVIHSVDEMNIVRKKEGVQMNFHLYFTELYKRMFQLVNQNITETTLESLFSQIM